MTDAERAAAIDVAHEERPQTPRTMSSSLLPFVPNLVEKRILRALDGAALTSGELDSEVNKDHSQVQKALRHLEALGRVKKLPKRRGYCRPDRPPADHCPEIE